MRHAFRMSVAALLMLAGCDGSQNAVTAPMMDKAAYAPAPPPPSGVSAVSSAPQAKLAYMHNLTLEMADDKIAPRFERARDACLNDSALNCSLMAATVTVGDANIGVRPSAHLSLRLPHASVQKFRTALLAPLPGEEKGQPALRQSSTNAEDLSYQLLDVERRLAQQTDYRDRLNALSTRADAKVDDLIKVEEQIAQVQSQIEALTAQNRQLNARVDTEVLNIELNPYASLGAVSSPLGEAWHNGAQRLGESAAAALTFMIVMLPWLPIIALGVYLLSLLWQRIKKARANRAAKRSAAV